MVLELRNNEIRNPNSIAVIGASARSAAFSVLRSGRSTVAADLFADADLVLHCPTTRISSYPDGLLDWLAATDVAAWLYTGALENYPDLVERLATVRPLLGNSGEALRRCRDPARLQITLSKNGLYFPETRASCVGLPTDGSWLCKTYQGSSGSGVWEFVGKESRQQAEACGACFQKRVEGSLVSVVFVLGNTWTKILGMTTQWVGSSRVGAAKFQYAGSLGIGPSISATIRAQIDALAHTLADQFQLRGLVGVDLMLDSGRAWLLEINPRYTASVEVVERNRGILAIEAHLAACTGNRLDFGRQEKPAGRLHGKAILYAKREVTINADFFAWAMAQAGYGLDSRLADIPDIGCTIPSGSPVLSLFASATATEIDRSLRRRIAEVETRLYSP